MYKCTAYFDKIVKSYLATFQSTEFLNMKINKI